MMFLIGAAPALLALVIRRGLKEPKPGARQGLSTGARVAGGGFEPVVNAGERRAVENEGRAADTAVADPDSPAASRDFPPVARAPQMGSYTAMFGHPRWRKHALLGLVLAFSGVVGLWGWGFSRRT